MLYVKIVSNGKDFEYICGEIEAIGVSDALRADMDIVPQDICILRDVIAFKMFGLDWSDANKEKVVVAENTIVEKEFVSRCDEDAKLPIGYKLTFNPQAPAICT